MKYVSMVFGHPRRDMESPPLVDLWYDLTKYLTEETIPSPRD